MKTYIFSCYFFEVLEQIYRSFEGCHCDHLQHTLRLFQKNILQRWNDWLEEKSLGYCLLKFVGYYPSSLQTIG